MLKLLLESGYGTEGFPTSCRGRRCFKKYDDQIHNDNDHHVNDNDNDQFDNDNDQYVNDNDNDHFDNDNDQFDQ